MPDRGPVVLDTNTIVSGVISVASIPGRVLAVWRAGQFKLLSSSELADEADDVLRRPHIRVRHRMGDAEIVEFVAELSANLVEPLPLDALPVHCRDADDDNVLACALGGGAEFIVTGDSDLLALDGDPALGDLRIVTPRTFLEMLDARDVS